MKEREGDDPDHLVPSEWVPVLCPKVYYVGATSGCDTGDSKYGFTRDFQTFFSVVIFSTLFFFTFHMMKKKETAHSD